MIYLKMSGRLGNQFFQYAAVKSYRLKNKIEEPVIVSFEEVYAKKSDNKTFIDYLKYFKVDEYKVVSRVKYAPKQKFLDIYFRFLVKVIRRKARKGADGKICARDYEPLLKRQKMFNENGLYYYIPGMKEYYKSKAENIIFFGSYEDHSLFDKYSEEIRKDLVPKKSLSPKNEKLLKEIKESKNTVCMSIRLGDFLFDEFRKDFYICTPEYFYEAIEIVKKELKNPRFVIFSSDIKEVKEKFNFPEGTLYENEGSEVWESLYLISNCDNYIMSNSTFSWWGQFLSNAENKRVYAPSRWNNFEYCDLIYQDNWKLINVDKKGNSSHGE